MIRTDKHGFKKQNNMKMISYENHKKSDLNGTGIDLRKVKDMKKRILFQDVTNVLPQLNLQTFLLA